MNAPQPIFDWKRGMLEARLRFWLTVPNAEAMCAKIEAELLGMPPRLGDAHSEAESLPAPEIGAVGSASDRVASTE